MLYKPRYDKGAIGLIIETHAVDFMDWCDAGWQTVYTVLICGRLAALYEWELNANFDVL